MSNLHVIPDNATIVDTILQVQSMYALPSMIDWCTSWSRSPLTARTLPWGCPWGSRVPYSRVSNEAGVNLGFATTLWTLEGGCCRIGACFASAYVCAICGRYYVSMGQMLFIRRWCQHISVTN